MPMTEKSVEKFSEGIYGVRIIRNKQKKIISLTCYDNLIYLQNSEDSYYYPAGWKTVDIFNDICSKWGINLVYNYESIEHKKLPISGKISTMFTDLLDRV